MQAVINAVRDFLPHLRSRVVPLMCDNAVTVAYIKNEGEGARDRTLWCRWPYDCSSGATARRLRWFPSICQECTSSRRIPCPEAARHWPRSGRWPWSIYDPCLPSGASHRSICLRHSPTDDSSSSYRRIRTPERSGQMPCPCLGTTGWASCTRSRHSSWSLKYCRRSLSHQESGWFLIAPLQQAASCFRSWWICSKKIRSRCLRGSRPADSRRVVRRRGDRDSSLLAVKSTRVESLRAILRAKGHSREAARMMSRSVRESSSCKVTNPIGQDLWRSVGRKDDKCFESEVIISALIWCTSRDGLFPSTIISYRTSVASVLRHWVYDPAADPHIKLLFRAFRLKRPVERRIMSKWDLHLVLFSWLRPPFCIRWRCWWGGESSDDVIPLKWQNMKCVFLVALASARRRLYLHALSVAPGRCVFARETHSDNLWYLCCRNLVS